MKAERGESADILGHGYASCASAKTQTQSCICRKTLWVTLAAWERICELLIGWSVTSRVVRDADGAAEGECPERCSS
ncbi:hypothetical protein SZ55_3537 [Pseudomonas sp. FeS53a]|nr:hypothetical protein SZ55_3537 [Pseudomonas sp. FeS53a]